MNKIRFQPHQIDTATLPKRKKKNEEEKSMDKNSTLIVDGDSIDCLSSLLLSNENNDQNSIAKLAPIDTD